MTVNEGRYPLFLTGEAEFVLVTHHVKYEVPGRSRPTPTQVGTSSSETPKGDASERQKTLRGVTLVYVGLGRKCETKVPWSGFVE